MSSPEITLLLSELSRGRRDALDRLLPLIYDELRALAHHRLAGQAPGRTLTTTSLVHEAYLKLFDQTALVWNDRRHFFAVAAKAMRQIVIDHARRRSARKRGGGVPAVELDPQVVGGPEPVPDVLALDDALRRLEELDPRLGRVVELRFFTGLTVEETADVLRLGVRTVKRDWRKARAFLFDCLGPAA